MTFSLSIKTAEELKSKKLSEEQEKKRLKALNYLADTDWYITRQVETGKTIPKDVLSERAKARQEANIRK